MERVKQKYGNKIFIHAKNPVMTSNTLCMNPLEGFKEDGLGEAKMTKAEINCPQCLLIIKECKESDSQLNEPEKSNSGTSTSYLARPKTIEEIKEEFYQQMKDGITFSGQTNSYLINQSLWNWLENVINEERRRATKCL